VTHVEGLSAVGYGLRRGRGVLGQAAGSPLAGIRRCTAPITWVTGSRARALRTHLSAAVLGIMRRMLVLVFWTPAPATARVGEQPIPPLTAPPAASRGEFPV